MKGYMKTKEDLFFEEINKIKLENKISNDDQIKMLLECAKELGFDISGYINGDGKKSYFIWKRINNKDYVCNPILDGDWIKGFPNDIKEGQKIYTMSVCKKEDDMDAIELQKKKTEITLEVRNKLKELLKETLEPEQMQPIFNIIDGKKLGKGLYEIIDDNMLDSYNKGKRSLEELKEWFDRPSKGSCTKKEGTPEGALKQLYDEYIEQKIKEKKNEESI